MFVYVEVIVTDCSANVTAEIPAAERSDIVLTGFINYCGANYFCLCVLLDYPSPKNR
jgi:hypothetical protein